MIETLSHTAGQEQDYTLTVSGETVVATGDARLRGLEMSGVNLTLFSPEVAEYARNVAGDASYTTVVAAPAPGATAVIAPADADAATDGHQVSLTADGVTVVTVAVTSPNGTNNRVYTVTLTQLAGTTHPLSDDATLSALSLSGIDIGEFDGAVAEYRYVGDFSQIDSVTVSATATHAGASVAMEPADADDVAEGRRVAVSGDTVILRIMVTAQDGEATRTYVVRLF